MIGWTAQGREVTLSAWQERSVRALLDPRHSQVLIVRGRQWGWSTVLETARRYDANMALLRYANPDEDVPAPAGVFQPPAD